MLFPALGNLDIFHVEKEDKNTRTHFEFVNFFSQHNQQLRVNFLVDDLPHLDQSFFADFGIIWRSFIDTSNKMLKSKFFIVKLPVQ